MAITRPVKNAGEKYIWGLNIAWATDSTLTATLGGCRDSSNVNDIEVAAALTLDYAISGAGGLDTGAIANATIYAVYVIDSSYGRAAAALMMSTDAADPLMPADYDMKRRIGFVRTDGTADFLLFYQTGSGKDRWMHYDVSIATDITAGGSASFADVDCTGSVPLIQTIIDVDCTYTPTAGNDELVLVPNGSTSTNGVVRMSGAVAAVIEIGHMQCPCESDATLEYKVTGSAVALNVQGYLDVL